MELQVSKVWRSWNYHFWKGGGRGKLIMLIMTISMANRLCRSWLFLWQIDHVDHDYFCGKLTMSIKTQQLLWSDDFGMTFCRLILVLYLTSHSLILIMHYFGIHQQQQGIRGGEAYHMRKWSLDNEVHLRERMPSLCGDYWGLHVKGRVKWRGWTLTKVWAPHMFW